MILICNNEIHADEAVAWFVKNYVLMHTNRNLDGDYADIVVGDFIVKLAPLYREDEKPIEENEYLEFDYNGDWCWLNDWDEGQKCVIVYGITPIDKVKPYWVCGEESGDDNLCSIMR